MSELGPMLTGGSQKRAPHFPLPDLRWRGGWSPYTGLQDPAVTGAARSSSDPTTTAAWYVTIWSCFVYKLMLIITICPNGAKLRQF